jgi:hypothetical protein
MVGTSETAHGAIADPTEARNAKKRDRKDKGTMGTPHAVAEIW